jgi:two-component system, NarL family, nitrate/nitrite response regulator NarL
MSHNGDSSLGFINFSPFDCASYSHIGVIGYRAVVNDSSTTGEFSRKGISGMLRSLGTAISEQGTGAEEADGRLQQTRPGEPCESAATVLVVGVDRLFRETLKLFLEADGFAAIEARTLDDLDDRMALDGTRAILIYSLSGDTAIEQDLACILEARRRFPGLRTLVLAGTINAATFLQTVAAGIEGLMLKDISGDVLQRAIRLVLLGQHLFPAGLAQHLVTAQNAAAETAPQAAPASTVRPAPVATGERTLVFSEREHQILQCLVNGLSNKAIARKHHIAEATVKVHVKGLLRKVQVSNRTQAAIWALNHINGVSYTRVGTEAPATTVQSFERADPPLPPTIDAARHHAGAAG